jgi:hypothetical protein
VKSEAVLSTTGLITFWDFQQDAGEPKIGRGRHAYVLEEMAGPVRRIDGGVFGPHAARLGPGQWLRAPRAHCPALNLCGPQSQVTVVAWLKREQKELIPGQCEAVAGMWNETRARRQYCLFLNLRIFESADQVCGHVSGVGGPTPGQRYCMDASIGATPMAHGKWSTAGFTYDGRVAKSYLNGKLDAREGRNPYVYELGLFDGGSDGADFTVGAVDRSGEMGNWYQGAIGGLAVFNRALREDEMEKFTV